MCARARGCVGALERTHSIENTFYRTRVGVSGHSREWNVTEISN